MALVELDCGEGIPALGLELGELFAPYALLLVELALDRSLVRRFARLDFAGLVLGHLVAP